MAELLNSRDLEFLLYEFLSTESLLDRPRYHEHSREVFDATLETARRIAETEFAPHFAQGDGSEPQFVDGQARVIPQTRAAWDAFAAAGFLNAHWDASDGGSQLPEVIVRAAMAWFKAANVATASYSFLTIGAANLLRSFGSAALQGRFLAAMGDGRCAGTMALTEPAQGSALGDLTTRAVPHADGSFRLFGQKMFISGGDQDVTQNIAHMVLARIEGAPAGVAGISLFLVPKYLVDERGDPVARNDVVLAGLLHKMGWRNTTSTVLNFGEGAGAVGYLIGAAGKGLAQMFQMMNEARIGIGLCAATTAYRGYLYALDYARERRQGRLPSCRDPLSSQVALIEHADVRRLLLAQKVYAEGALALCLYAAALVEDQRTHPDPARRLEAGQVLDVLTPVVKSWPARYGCIANDMAIQVLGGAGYTRDHPLEQLYRDQRLNPIHEGTEGIQAIDLLGRKVVMDRGAAYHALRARIDATLAELHSDAELQPLAQRLRPLLAHLDAVTRERAEQVKTNPDAALADASVYLDAFGRITMAWIWLLQARAASQTASERRPASADFYAGKRHGARYFFDDELPIAAAELERLVTASGASLAMQPAWF